VSGDGGEELREQLAAIEHERWADWQAWCHKILRENCPSPELEKVLKRWDLQIETTYDNLTSMEKDSDREQVDRYWPLIERLLDAQYNAGLAAAGEAGMSNLDLSGTTTYIRKPIYFDITPHWLNPELCKRNIDSMMYELKVKYKGRYVFDHEERLAKDSRGEAGLLRRHYFVDIEQDGADHATP
jgi:hypothetical protein